LHALLSLQTSGVPTQEPPEQVSPVVHAVLSSQGFVFGAFTQPDPGSQLSSVQMLLSSQFGGVPAMQLPSTGLQVPTPLQALPSSQLTGVPVQVPAAQVSPVVQSDPSSQLSVFGAFTQPPGATQESLVQEFASSQSGGGLFTQPLPGSQTSVPLQALPSSQTIGVPTQAPA
jgi:hypothetical protein